MGVRVWLVGFGCVLASSSVCAQPQGNQEASRLAASAGFVDIVGIKLGSAAPAVLHALQKHNPALKLNPHAIQLEGFGNRDITLAIAAEPASGAGPETFTLAFTTPPSAELLWGIRRNVAYQGKWPTLDNLLTGLRQKYGEHMAKRPHAHLYYWAFDDAGKPLTAQAALAYATRCGDSLDPHAVQREIISGSNHWTGGSDAADPCAGATLVTASLGEAVGQDASGRPLAPGLADYLIVTIENRSLRRAGIDATRATALKAAAAREAEQASEATQRGVPDL